jgi:hypothetical protein
VRHAVAIVFVASFASTLIERGMFFLAHEGLQFSDELNLWLALLYGALYVAGALVSHAVATRVGERRALVVSSAVQIGVQVALAVHCTTTSVFAAAGAIAIINGFKWPILESYVNAGLTPAQSFGMIGRFNLAWASAIPLALGVEGRMIAVWPTSPVALAALINAALLAVFCRLAASPTLLADDHPARPAPAVLAREGALLAASRWTMLLSYIGLWVVTPLAPGIFARLGVGGSYATVLASSADWARLAAFAALMANAWWRGRVWVLVLSFAILPAGFFATVLAESAWMAAAGLAATGFAAGLAYYAALSYAMTVKNASVEAGGGHESFIGAGFFFGPLAGLAGIAATSALGSTAAGMAVGLGPCIVVCGVVGFALTTARLRRAP